MTNAHSQQASKVTLDSTGIDKNIWDDKLARTDKRPAPEYRLAYFSYPTHLRVGPFLAGDNIGPKKSSIKHAWHRQISNKKYEAAILGLLRPMSIY